MSRFEMAVKLPVVEVTLLEDRAHVVRRGRVVVGSGHSRLRVEDVAPVIVDKTLCAAVVSRTAVDVLDARVERRRVFEREDTPPKQQSIDDELDRVTEELEKQTVMYRIEADNRDNLRTIAESTADEISEDVSWGSIDAEGWSGRLDAIQAELRSSHAKLLKRKEVRRTLEEDRRDLQRAKQAAATPADSVHATMLIDVSATDDTDLELRVEYVVPGACWRPYHTARLVGADEDALAFSTDACVWQNTGEDWSGVKLRFSTERPSLGTQPPELEPDVLHTQKKQEAVVVQAREQVIHHDGLGAGAKELITEVPGIDDGGHVLDLGATAAATVPSDGRPHRVPISSFEGATRHDLVLMAELTNGVHFRSEQTNGGPGPILPGPCDLIRSSGKVGCTSVSYVAPGEKFELGWGPEPSLRVHRTHDQLEEKSKTLSSWWVVPHRVRIRVSNIGDTPHTIEVTERIPVSEIDKVRVKPDKKKSSRGATPDDDGFVRWTIDVGAHGHETLELAYTIEKHGDVIGI